MVILKKVSMGGILPNGNMLTVTALDPSSTARTVRQQYHQNSPTYHFGGK